jgi:hypothetical protein
MANIIEASLDKSKVDEIASVPGAEAYESLIHALTQLKVNCDEDVKLLLKPTYEEFNKQDVVDRFTLVLMLLFLKSEALALIVMTACRRVDVQ